MPLGPQGAFLFTGALPQAPRLPALVLLRCDWFPLAADAAFFISADFSLFL
jgi:hypothetical protein